jgi:hypothetical protein
MAYHRKAPGRSRLRLVSVVIGAGLLVGSVATGAGAAKLDNGVGTQAASDNPQCDPELGRVKFVYSGWVPCVKAWEAGANNGGATSPGVTADSIKVVVRKPPQQTSNESRSPIRDRATGEFASVEDSVRDTVPIFERTYQQWGRKLDVEVFEMSGTDEAAQRADAVTVAEMKPFAVIDITDGADVFLSEMTNRKILAIGGMFPNRAAIEQAPYRWPVALDSAANAFLGAEFVGNTLVGKPAQFAGDESMQDTKRVFGTVRPEGTTAPDYQPALDELDDHGAKVTTDLTYEPPLNVADLATVAEQNAATWVARLKDSGVTSVLVLADYQVMGPVTKAATAADYFPEWVLMGAGLVDVGVLGRTMDQEQWAHAFGVSGLWVPVADITAGPSDVAFQWYWGPSAGVYSQAIFADFELLFAGIHMAGPKLTPANFKAGIFSRPPTGGAAEDRVTEAGRFYGKKARLPYDEYMTGGDVAIVWWDPDTVGPSTAATLPDAKGVYQFIDDAKRFRSGQLPTKLPAFFEASSSTYVLPTTPPAEQQPDYPCDGCPSSGGAA